MSEFHPLSPESDYTISSTDGTSTMDDVSLTSSRVTHSRHNNNGNGPLSSGASVSSKFSRASRKSMKNSDLGIPLTSSLEERDENGSNGAGDWVGATALPPSTNGNTSSATPTTTRTTTTTTKSYISEDDPFYMFRTDLVQKLTSVDEGLHRYLTVVRTTDTAANTHQVKETKKQLKRHIKHAESTLSDLETTVRVVEKSREKFPHINHVEIMERRGFVDDSKDRIAGAKMSMQSEEVRHKFVRDEGALTERRRGGGKGGGASSATTATTNGYRDVNDLESGNNNNNHNDPERSETLLMMQQQDETLDDLDMAVTRVGYMAETIHEEIDTQNVMLTNLEDDLADAEEQLGVVMGKLAKLLKTKSKCQLGLIVVLSLIVLVLFFLVIYT